MAVRIALAGDTMRGRGVAAQIAAAGTGGLFSAGVRDCFASADLALLNLECCVSARAACGAGGPSRSASRPRLRPWAR